ncbi:uncharacterized protein BDZ83DRAFT_100275 [Colletotrichum acutatum]|uniref:Uncharacterized protein n=1 Tax=Glomerella acutata TaxID=27357 RepID=A0AAD8UWP9_GLOAC|nr:uncharacterized protein BDZ83DRAFT_100275 [Colletotrichum acutatum]KAK1728756.1 hypothetical protein BDZ83DRAFT_100275 [Colletotrichum acutatum]
MIDKKTTKQIAKEVLQQIPVPKHLSQLKKPCSPSVAPNSSQAQNSAVLPVATHVFTTSATKTQEKCKNRPMSPSNSIPPPAPTTRVASSWMA